MKLFLALILIAGVSAGEVNTAKALRGKMGGVITGPKCTKAACSVLVVVDMQNDYCNDCGSTSSTITKWAGPLSAVATKINTCALKDKWDLVIFTQDWLASKTGFLVAGTEGAKLVPQLATSSASPKAIRFTKTADDWMNEMSPTTAFDKKYHFAMHGEATAAHGDHPTLMQVLCDLGYTAAKTTIHTVGTATNRCVMKGSVHAATKGYKVSMHKALASPKGEVGLENWVTKGPTANAPPLTAPQTANHKKKWVNDIFTGYKGGPKAKDALTYMKEAGVQIVDNDTC